MKFLLILISLVTLPALANAHGRSGTVISPSDIKNKVDFVESLRSLQIRVYELEDSIYGSEKYDSKGLIVELKKCTQSLSDKSNSGNFAGDDQIDRFSEKEGKFIITFQTYDKFLNLPASVIVKSMDRLNVYRVKYEAKGRELEEKLAACRFEVSSKLEFKRQIAKNNLNGDHEFRIAGFERQFVSFMRDGLSLDREVSINNLIIQFGDPTAAGCSAREGYTVYACCSRHTGEPPTVTVDQATWDSGDGTEHERLVYHELGHCLLDLNHREERTTDIQRASLMYPVLDRTMNDFYKNHRLDFVRELFITDARATSTQRVFEAILIKK